MSAKAILWFVAALGHNGIGSPIFLLVTSHLQNKLEPNAMHFPNSSLSKLQSYSTIDISKQFLLLIPFRLASSSIFFVLVVVVGGWVEVKSGLERKRQAGRDKHGRVCWWIRVQNQALRAGYSSKHDNPTLAPAVALLGQFSDNTRRKLNRGLHACFIATGTLGIRCNQFKKTQSSKRKKKKSTKKNGL